MVTDMDTVMAMAMAMGKIRNQYYVYFNYPTHSSVTEVAKL